MSIRARVDDSLLLWNNGRLEGAFLNALVAVAATSRRRFPKNKVQSDREAFIRFLNATRTVRISVEYRNECLPVEQIFYKWFRCELVHEGSLPVDIEFIPDSEPNTMSVRAGGAPENILKVSHGWFNHMISSIASAPENAAEFK